MFSGVFWNQPVRPCVRLCVHVSVCVQNTTFCKNAGGGIKSHSMTAVVFTAAKQIIISGMNPISLSCLCVHPRE